MKSEEITIELPNDILLKLALAAHEKGITMNELVSDILYEYIDDKMEHSVDSREIALKESVCSMILHGITVDTIRNYTKTYIDWFENGESDNTLSNIIQDGFDLATDIVNNGSNNAG
jgi:hypothetical protein